MRLAAFATLLERFDSECDRFGLTHTLDSSGAAEYFATPLCPCQYKTTCISYMDDVNRPIMCRPSSIVSSIRTITRIMVRTFHMHTFIPNFKIGKTEALIMHIGDGRKEVCQHIKIELDSIIKVTIPPARDGHVIDVRCVDMYRHLGTHQTCISSIVPLLRIRNAATKSAHTAVKKAIF